MFRYVIYSLLLGCLFSASHVVGSLSDANAKTSQTDITENTTFNNDDIEVIQVTGQRSLYQLKNRVTQARLDFYDLFNQINDVDDYQVICKKVAKAGTRIRRLRCEPVYYINTAAQLSSNQLFEAQLLTTDGGPPRIPSHVVNEASFIMATRKKREEAGEHMQKLIEDNPTLYKKYQALITAQQAYEKKKKR